MSTFQAHVQFDLCVCARLGGVTCAYILQCAACKHLEKCEHVWRASCDDMIKKHQPSTTSFTGASPDCQLHSIFFRTTTVAIMPRRPGATTEGASTDKTSDSSLGLDTSVALMTSADTSENPREKLRNTQSIRRRMTKAWVNISFITSASLSLRSCGMS